MKNDLSLLRGNQFWMNMVPEENELLEIFHERFVHFSKTDGLYLLSL